MAFISNRSPGGLRKQLLYVVTGANKGVGYEIVRGFAEQGLTVVLTARDQARGQAAVDGLKAAGLETIWFHQLDLVSSDSVEKLATWLENQFGGIDILVSNAGIIGGSGPGVAGMAVTYENAKEIVETNHYGTKNVTESLLPLLRPSPAAARIVNVTSRAALYERLKKESLKRTLRNEDNYTKELSDSLAAKYLEHVKADTIEEEGWVPKSSKNAPMYSESKIFLNIYAIALAKSLAKSQPEDHQILISSFCPGATQTDMLDRLISERNWSLPPEFKLKSSAEGADTGVWLALLPKEELAEKVGKYYGEREEYPFGWENPPGQ